MATVMAAFSSCTYESSVVNWMWYGTFCDTGKCIFLKKNTWLLCLSSPALFRCRTIALETGFQNSQLCSTIVQLSFSPAELEIMFAFPLIYSIFQLVVAVTFVGSEYSRQAILGKMGKVFLSVQGLVAYREKWMVACYQVNIWPKLSHLSMLSVLSFMVR